MFLKNFMIFYWGVRSIRIAFRRNRAGGFLSLLVVFFLSTPEWLLNLHIIGRGMSRFSPERRVPSRPSVEGFNADKSHFDISPD